MTRGSVSTSVAGGNGGGGGDGELLMLRAILLSWLLILSGVGIAAELPATKAAFSAFQVNGAHVAPSCSSSVLDSFAASPGAWTVAVSFRKLKAAYAGSGFQLQRSSDNSTQDIGFVGCDPDTTSASSFCTSATLTVGTTTSTRAAFPSGSVIHAFNQGPSPIFYAAGNSSVTATTSSTPLQFGTGVSITVGANTNIAALIGTGYGINGGSGSATLYLTNCGIAKVYDQSGNTNDVTQATQANQLGYMGSCAGSLPCATGCLNCLMMAADSASYKTTAVETFTVLAFGEDITTDNFNYGGVGYPTTTSSTAADLRWGLSNNSYPDVLSNNMNGSPFGNAEGFGGLWRGQNLTQYDYSTGGITRWNGGTQFMNTGSGTPTYPNAVGIYVMGDSTGAGAPGMFTEALVASGTQTARNAISANQVAYWGITAGVAQSVALTNPLGDGWNWNQIQLGGFAPNPPGVGAITVNGNAYNSEASWNNYTQWQATNGLTTSGRLGDNWRFQITGLSDQWDGTNRSEIDGAGSAQFNNGTTFWLAYAVYIEPGTAYTSSWNINGQMHTTGASAMVCCAFNTTSNSNSVTDTWSTQTFNAATGTQTSTTTGVPITRGRWYHYVYQVLVSTSGTGDTFNVWLDTVTAGTMVQIASHTSATLFGGNSVNTSNYWKYGIYRETGNNLPTFAIQYGNMQVCSQGADCTSKYGVSDLSALTTTPLPDPSH